MQTLFYRTKNKKVTILSVLILHLLILLIVSSNNTSIPNHISKSNYKFNDVYDDTKLKDSNGDSILFQGIEDPLNVSDYGKLYKNNQKVYLTNEEELNLTYYLDEAHDWQVSKIENSVNNIQDTRDWINNSDFQSPIIWKKSITVESDHPYNGNSNENNPPNRETITKAGALYIRVHFINITFESGFDYLFLFDKNDEEYLIDDFNKINFYSPWIPGDTIKINYRSDGFIEYYGYKIDYYEFLNISSNININNKSWGYNFKSNGAIGKNQYGSGKISNVSAMHVDLYGEYIDYGAYQYNQGAFSEIYQNLTIPRGSVIDAYINFDYYIEYGLGTNEHFIYMEVNKQRIYTLGMRDATESGRRIWRSSSKVNMQNWVNSTPIFDNELINQELNISIGIKSGASIRFTGFEEGFINVIWFDNISLTLTTIANSTQEGIELSINNSNLEEGNKWGDASQVLNDNRDKNPVILTFNTTSPSLTFELNTTLYGFCNLTTDYDKNYQDGVSYKILNNGSIYWEFLHDFFEPSEYTDFEFKIIKPKNWIIISAKDQSGDSRAFEGGKEGNLFLKINKTNIFKGWWTFTAISPNYLNFSNTKMLKNGQWVHTSFKSGESTRIKAQVNYSNEIPPNIDLSFVNLTIYEPEGSVWYIESKKPASNGTVIFSELDFNSSTTTGGYYNFTLFWSNTTALGGIKSSFLLIHNSSIRLIKPSDAVITLRTEGLVGDLIPLRVYLNDSERNSPISRAEISYNWTVGQQIHLEESVTGIYEAIIFTEDLSRGLSRIVINSSKMGYINSNLTLEINLGETTNLYVLESHYFIELHANSTIIFRFTDFDGSYGINDAIVKVNITEHRFYTINNTGNGEYVLEFNSSFINNLGIHQLHVNFSAIGYIPQFYVYQFQIVEQSVNLTIYLNNEKINQNSIIETSFNNLITVSARALAKNDKIYLDGGNFTWISESFTKNITEKVNNWYNTTFLCSTSSFSLGYNYVYIEFQLSGYATAIFPFQLIVNQIPIQVLPIDFEDSVDTFIGKDVKIEIQLKEPVTNYPIDGAIVSYSWEYGIGSLDSKGNGVYELKLELPEDIKEDDYKITIMISAGSAYKPTEYSFILDVTEEVKEELNLLFWIILTVLLAIIGVLSALSYRSYVYLPRKRKKEAELLTKTQRFKDLMNIQAIVVIHKQSGIPVFLKSYSILETQKKELFSGFIQAITSIGEEISGKKAIILEDKIEKEEKIIELDFKHFYCLICDKISVRVIFVLKEKSSDRLKTVIRSLSKDIFTNLIQKFEQWDGELAEFENNIPPHLIKHLELYYKEQFKLAKPQVFAATRKEMELNSMETRVINVIRSFAKNKSEFYLTLVLELVYEKNKDLIIEAIESLINKKLIIPYST